MDNVWFAILKYTGATFSATYGLYATLTDFRVVQPDGTKTLSRKGYIGISLLAVSSVLSLATGAIKDRIDAAEENKKDRAAQQARTEITQKLADSLAKSQDIEINLNAEQQLSRNISNDLAGALFDLKHNTQTTENILDRTSRLMQPLKELTVSFFMDVSSTSDCIQRYIANLDQHVRPRIEEMKNAAFNSPDFYVSSRIIADRTPLSISLTPRSILLSRYDDPAVVGALTHNNIYLDAFVSKSQAHYETSKTYPNADLRINMHGGVNDLGSETVEYNLGQRSLRIQGVLARSQQMWNNNGKIGSIPDLEKAYVCFGLVNLPGDNAQMEIRRAMDITWFQLRNSDGRDYGLKLDGPPRRNTEGFAIYCGKISDSVPSANFIKGAPQNLKSAPIAKREESKPSVSSGQTASVSSSQTASTSSSQAAPIDLAKDAGAGPYVARIKSRIKRTLHVGDSRVSPKDGLTYVWIPPGKFMMGCSSDEPEDDQCERPPHAEEIVTGFWLGQTEVTQAAWKKVMHSVPSSVSGDQLPVEQVDWNESSAYCKAVGGRLPTEKEWEYAARAGTTGSRYGALDEVAWHDGNSTYSHPVGQKKANAFGLYDMLGNVWEWTADDGGIVQYSDGKTMVPEQTKVMRGGAWSDTDAFGVRASYRYPLVPFTRGMTNGFRCMAPRIDAK